MTADIDAAAAYLRQVFGPDATNLGLSWLPTPLNGSSTPAPGMRSVFCADIDAATSTLARMNGEASGVYVRMTTLTHQPAHGKRGGVELSSSLPGLWADIDYGTVGHSHDPAVHHDLPLPPDEDQALAIIDAAQLPVPTVVVHSGGGLYPLWLLDEPLPLPDHTARSRASDISARWQAQLAAGAAANGHFYGSGVGDLTRVLRLPGTQNRKAPTARPCRVLSDDGPRYSLSELSGHLEDAELTSTHTATSTSDSTTYTRDQRDEYDFRDLDPDAGVFQQLHNDVGIKGVLLAAGWSECDCSRTDCVEHYTRPGEPENPHSAHVIEENPYVLVVHSEETGLPSGAGQRLTAGRLYALLHHGGDLSASARDLVHASSPEAAALAGWAPDPVPSLFDATATLRHIRTAARSRLLSETAVLLNVIGLRACEIDTTRKIPGVVGTRADLNLVLGTVGDSAAGKTASFRVARELMGSDDSTDLVRALGSGQGIAEQFMGEVLDDEGKRVRGPVPGLARLFMEDEVDAITAKGENASDSALGEIRKAYSGSHLGQSNATAERNRNIPDGSYRFVLVTNIQPGRSQGLFTDRQVHAGTPQRFVLLPATTLSGQDLAELVDNDELPEWPGELDLPMTDFHSGDFTIPTPIQREIRLTYLAGRDDLAGTLRGHRQLTKLKVAAVLADLHGEDTISEQWWALAETVMLISDIQIERCRTALAAQRAKDNKAVGTALAHQQFETTRTREALEDEDLEEIRGIVRTVLAEEGSAPRSTFRTRVGNRRRKRLQEAFDSLVEDGEIELVREQTGGRPKDIYQLLDTA